jgi:hypothetical protein
MVELEEGLFRLTTVCNAMEVDEPVTVYEPMEVDWTGLIAAMIAYFGPPPPLMRSEADFAPPPALVRSDGLQSATGIV